MVTATDAAGNVGLTKEVAITVTNANEAPVTSGTPLANKTAVVNQAFSYNTSTGFTDPDAGSTLTYSATGLPAGFTINPTSGVLSGTAASTFAATSITVTANDGSLSSSQSFTLEAVNGLIISSISHSTTTVKGGTALSFTVTMSENVTVTTTGGNPTLTLSVNGQSVTATYSSGSGTSALTFTATAPATGDGNAASVSAITIPGTSSIKDSATSAKNLLTTVTGQSTTALAIDNTAPPAPTLALQAASDTGTSSSDNLTNDTTLTFNVTGESGATVTLFNDSNSNGTVDTGESLGTVTLSGTTSGSITASALSGGSYANIKVKQTDAAGNAGSASAAHASITVDTTTPSATITDIQGNGTTVAFGSTTADTTPTLSGSVSNFAAGDTLTVLRNGASIGTATVSGSTWSFTDPGAPNGATADYTVRASDAAGNTSTSALYRITVNDTNANQSPQLSGPSTFSFSDDFETASVSNTIWD
ncbi:MAG: Ig-like domain-containing protein, partial [Candidatus Protistobacter heckmanni]|nr:Ig-like domain-containing protein [Candidatus Protistobacter heckmanni]